MMKCRKHPIERGGGDGVCASCLRDRLLALIVSQNELAAAAGDAGIEHGHIGSDSDSPPPLLLSPRSVSPYAAAAHRRSDASLSHHVHQRFFSTPQPCRASSDLTAAATCAAARSRWGERRRFSIFSALFGGNHRSGEDSWISWMIRRTKKKKKQQQEEERFEPDRTPCRGVRGLSPVRDEDLVGSSGYQIECSPSPAWWQRPEPTPVRRATAARGGGGGYYGMAGCLSPLVFASPIGGGGRRCGATEVGFAADMRVLPSPGRTGWSAGRGPVLGPNRSRKLADTGRFK